MRLSVYLALVTTAFLPAPAAAQNTGTVEGKVVNSATGEGIRKAVVTLNSLPPASAAPSGQLRAQIGVFAIPMNGGQSYSALTDATGKFHIDNVPAGAVTAMAMADGYNMMRGIMTKPVNLDPGQQLTGIEIKLAPLSVVTGKVTDENGEPLEGVTVSAARYFYGGGQPQLQPQNSAATDDRGQYRIFDLQPGRIYLSASYNQQTAMRSAAPNVHSDVPEESYGTVVYPGVADIAQATPHNLKPGEDWTGADFKMSKHALHHVRGRIDSSALPPGQRVTVNAQTCGTPTGFFPFSMPGMNRPDGTFDLSLTSGEWCLFVREQTRGNAGAALKRTIEVKDSDIHGITLAPPAPFTVKGTIVFDGTPPEHMPRLGISLRAEDGQGQQSGTAAGDLSFEIAGVFPGKHFLSLPMGGGFYAKSILYSGQDVSSGVIPDLEPGGALVLTFGTDAGEIEGQVQSGSLESGAQVIVVLMPDDAHLERNDLYRINTSAADRRFTFGGIAPGDFKIVAFEGLDFEDAENHDLLRLLASRAAPVTIHAGGHEQVSVTPVTAAELEKAKEQLR